MANEQGILPYLVNIVNQTGNVVVANIYNGIGNLYSHNIAYTLLGLSITIWAFLRIKDNGFNKDDIHKAMIWISVFIIIKVALSSYETYKDFLCIFQLPYKWVSAGVSAYGTAGNADAIINHFWKIAIDTGKGYAENLGWTDIGEWIILGLFLALALIVMIAICVMTILSQLMATILLSLCALVLPLICWSQTRSIFFSWLKLYIGMSLWAPLAILASGLPQSALDQITTIGGGQKYNTETMSVLIIPSVMCIFALFLLTKIPAWVSAIIGSADSSSGGSGLAGLASAGGMAMKRMAEGGKAYQEARKGGKGIGASIGAGVGTAVGGKLGGAATQKAPEIARAGKEKAMQIGRFIAKYTPSIK